MVVHKRQREKPPKKDKGLTKARKSELLNDFFEKKAESARKIINRYGLPEKKE